MRSHRAGTTPRRPSRRAAPVAIALVAAAGILLTACGGSDKPGYCSDRSALQQSVGDLRNVEVLQSGGVKRLQSQLQKVETDAKGLASSVKSDFPSESDAIQSSVSALKSAVQGLSANPSPQQLATVAADVKGVATAFQGFKAATDSKCS